MPAGLAFARAFVGFLLTLERFLVLLVVVFLCLVTGAFITAATSATRPKFPVHALIDLVFSTWLQNEGITQVRDGTLSRRAFRHKARPLRREILYHLRRGAGWRHRSIAGVCSQILTLEDTLFSFVDHEGIEPTNNHAERLARHPVLWRKSSFGTDSETGSRFVERILTVVATLRLQHRNVIDYVTDACRASLHHQSPPSLLPTPLHSLHVSQAA